MTAAPLHLRVKAALIDAAALMLLSMLAFFVPLKLGGVVLPMWGVLTVLVGWSVVPLAFLQQTVGMRLMGLELARLDGFAVDPANVMFRELLGRGLFPAAYLFTLVSGMFANALGLMAFIVPTGLALLMAVASVFAIAVVILGSLFGVTRPDGRGLADLMTRSMVVVAPARPLPVDPDDLAERNARRRTVLIRIVVFEVVLALGVVGTPWLLTRRVGESSSHRTERIKRQGLEQKFAARPGDEALARDLMDSLERAGLRDEARQVLERHQRAVEARESDRERVLREHFTHTPDERTAALLIELLEAQGRLDEAIAVYRTWLGPTPVPSRRAGFGHWLGVRGREAEAATELRSALSEDPLVPMGHTMLGIVLLRLEQLPEARSELFIALELDAEDEDARDAWDQVVERLGPLSTSAQATVRATVKRWSADAGTR